MSQKNNKSPKYGKLRKMSEKFCKLNFLKDQYPSYRTKKGLVSKLGLLLAALIQDTGYMVLETYHDIAPYLVAFGAYLMPQ